MSVEFAAKLSELRRENNITQKNAAEELGISQALLSHYEKGIRECHLEFVVKAAQYYGVTTDWLLGNSDNKYPENTLFDASDSDTDFTVKAQTILKSLIYLYNHSQNNNDSEIFFNDFFSVAIKKYIAITENKDVTLSKLCDLAISENEATKLSFDDSPQCIKTLEEHAMKLIGNKLKSTSDL